MTIQNTYTTDELLKEAAWERKAIDEGVARYYEHMEKTGIAGSDVGTSLLMRITPKIAESIKAKQEEYSDMLTEVTNDASRRSSAGAGVPLLCMVNPDNLAVAVANGLLSLLLCEAEVSLRQALDVIEEAYIQAMGVQLWDQEEPEASAYFWATQADKISGMGGSRSARSMKRRRLKERMAKLWEEFAEQDNATEQLQLDLSTTILSCVGFTRVRVIDGDNITEDQHNSLMFVDNYPCVVEKEVGPLAGTFVLRDHLVASRMERHLTLSDEAAAAVDAQIERGELSAVRNPVMLVKPKRWILATA